MIRLFLDIETLPGDESLKQDIAANIGPPRNISRFERIKQWEEEEKQLEVEKRYRDTSLRGHTGRILCIGYIKDLVEETTEGILSGDEQTILRVFWELAQDVDLFVGFNLLDFDLKYIWQRSVINGMVPSRELNFARFRSEPIYDVMQEWGKWGRGYISLDALAKALGIDSPKGELDGSKVYDYYLEGRQREIYDYCMRDVVATKKIYEKLNFLPSKERGGGTFGGFEAGKGGEEPMTNAHSPFWHETLSAS